MMGIAANLHLLQKLNKAVLGITATAKLFFIAFEA